MSNLRKVWNSRIVKIVPSIPKAHGPQEDLWDQDIAQTLNKKKYSYQQNQITALQWMLLLIFNIAV